MASHVTSGPLKPWRIAGRKSELEAIQSALTRRDKSTRILYFVAPAGIGKTRLLQETERMAKESFSDSCQFGGFYDFNDTELHSNSRLEQRILDNLDPAKEKFTAYRVLRHEFEEDRRMAPIPTRLDEKRRELGKLFVQGLNEISAKKLVFCFDTLEALQYESDDIQRLIGPIIQQVAIETREWLATHLPLIENVVIILAGRPKPSLEDYLKDAFASVEYQRIELSNFDPAAVQEYFTVMAETYEREQQPIVARQMREMAKPENTARAHALTEGRPLMLAFATDLLHYGRQLPDEFRPDGKLPADPKVLQGKLANAVMNDIPSNIAPALPFIALASKGVDAELLERLMHDEVSPAWDRAKCEQVLQTLSVLSYAKPTWDKEGKLVMRLHDEMVDLLHNSVIHPHIEEYAARCEPIIRYYDNKIRAATTAGNRPEEFKLRAEQLWYRFVQNPHKGYEEYSSIFDRAIINRQIGLDMLVRDEMLRFFQPNVKENNLNLERARKASNGALTAGRINRGAGIRWVHRLVATGRFQDAITVAQELKKSDLKDPVEDPLFIPILDTWEGEAKAYLGVELADQIATLNRAIKGFDDAESKLKTDYMKKLWARNKGRAYNTRGYAYSGANECLQAVKDFRTALPYLRETGLPHQIVDTIKNLAFDNLRTGQFLAAGILCCEALRICEEYDLAFLKGLTLNTFGLVDLMADRPHRAVAWAKQAIESFENLQEGGERRGIGLAELALGEAYRRIAKLGIYPHSQIVQFMQDSEQALKVGLDTFKSDGPSPEQPREVEAHQELGCLYRQWARYLRGLDKPDSNTIAVLEDKALQHFNTALALASVKTIGAQPDLLNDLAELYGVQGQFDRALETLKDSDTAIATIDPNYLLTNGQGQPTNPMLNLFVILGKNSFLRGRMALRDEDLGEAAKHYTFASAYFDCFVGDQSAQEVMARRIYRIYDDLVAAGLTMDELRKFRQRVEEVEAQVLFNRPGFRRPTTLCHNFNDVLVIVSPIL